MPSAPRRTAAIALTHPGAAVEARLRRQLAAGIRAWPDVDALLTACQLRHRRRQGQLLSRGAAEEWLDWRADEALLLLPLADLEELTALLAPGPAAVPAVIRRIHELEKDARERTYQPDYCPADDAAHVRLAGLGQRHLPAPDVVYGPTCPLGPGLCEVLSTLGWGECQQAVAALLAQGYRVRRRWQRATVALGQLALFGE